MIRIRVRCSSEQASFGTRPDEPMTVVCYTARPDRKTFTQRRKESKDAKKKSACTLRLCTLCVFASLREGSLSETLAERENKILRARCFTESDLRMDRWCV